MAKENGHDARNGLHRAPQESKQEPGYIRVCQVGLFLALLPVSVGLKGLIWGYHKIRDKAIKYAQKGE